MINKIFKMLGVFTVIGFLVFYGDTSYSDVSFRGETIELIAPFKAGGGTDRLSRFYAPLLADALPGKPNVVVKNMPGGGSTKGANFFANRARPDGRTLIMTAGSTQVPYLLDDRRVRYEYKDWNIVLGSPTGGVLYASPELGISSASEIHKLRGKKLKFASIGPVSLDIIPLLAFDLLGLDVQVVFGMKGRKGGRLAFLRGEANLDYQTTPAYLKGVKPDADAGKAIPLLSWGSVDAEGNLTRDPTFPDLPHLAEAYEMVYGQKPRGPGFEAWKTFFVAGFAAQKMIFLPKGTSKEIINTYTNAFTKIITEPGFASKNAGKIGRYKQVTGAEAEVLKKNAITVSRRSKQWIKNWLRRKYKAKI